MITWEEILETPKGEIPKSRQQRLVDYFHNGDEQAYLFAHTLSRSDRMKWSHLTMAAETLPQLEQECLEKISQVLGYLPHRGSTLPHEPFIRHLLQSYQKGVIDLVEYRSQLEEHLVNIRNDDMQRGGWNFFETHTPVVLKNYQLLYAAYSQKARQRIARFLGYYPELSASLEAEMMLREALANDQNGMPDKLTHLDLKALTIVKYREILVNEGKEAADDSPLFDLMSVKDTGFADLDERFAAFNERHSK